MMGKRRRQAPSPQASGFVTTSPRQDGGPRNSAASAKAMAPREAQRLSASEPQPPSWEKEFPCDAAQRWAAPGSSKKNRSRLSPGLVPPSFFSRLANGERFRSSTELGPMLLQSVPGLGDDFVEPFPLWQTIILREGSGEFLPGGETRLSRSGGRSPPSERIDWKSWLRRAMVSSTFVMGHEFPNH